MTECWSRHRPCTQVLVKGESTVVPHPLMRGWNTTTRIGAWHGVSQSLLDKSCQIAGNPGIPRPALSKASQMREFWCTSSLQPHIKKKARLVKRMKVSSLVKDLAKDQSLESLLELVHHGLSKVERSTECRGMKCRRNKVQRGGGTRLVLGGYYCQGSRASQWSIRSFNERNLRKGFPLWEREVFPHREPTSCVLVLCFWHQFDESKHTCINKKRRRLR